jgi:hypothetical protein
MSVHWGWDDVRIVGDILIGSLLASGVRLVVVKAFLEPAAVFIGQRAYRGVDRLSGDRLPDLFPAPGPDQ